MTDFSRKRTLTEFFNGSADHGAQNQPKPVKNEKRKRKPLEDRKGGNLDDAELDLAVDKALLNAKKVLKQEEEDCKRVTIDHLKSGFDSSLMSFYGIAEHRPQLLQSAVKELLSANESAEQLQSVLKTTFLYFFQLLGIREDDHASLEILMAHLAAKNSNTGKEKEIAKAKLDRIDFDLDSIAFMAKGKRATAHLRQFKRFCKVLTTNLVDLFPDRKQFTLALVREILNFSRCKMRLLRLCFTHIGLYLFNQLLVEVAQLQTLRGFFTGQAQVNQDRIQRVDEAKEFFLNQVGSQIASGLIVARAVDAHIFVRRCVYEHLALLAPTELKLACQIQNFKLVPMLFKGIQDDEAAIFAMQTILKISQRMKVSTDKTQLKLLEKAFGSSQMTLMKMALPTPDNLARKVPAMAISLLESMAQFFPNTFTQQSKKQIASGLHSGDSSVRDAAAKFLISICSDFDDFNSLLEVQRAPKSGKERDEQDGEEAQMTINFVSEPNKSKKQLHKLLNAVSTFVQSRADFQLLIKQSLSSGDPQAATLFFDQVEQSESFLSRLLGQSNQTVSDPAEERAKILAAVFGKRTSIVFDAAAICELFCKETQSEENKQTLAQLLFIQLVLVRQNMQQQNASQAVYSQYWEHSRQVLTLSKLNEMIKVNRDKQDLVQVLLKVLLVLANSQQGLESDSNDSAGDILNLLTATISSVSPSDANKVGYLKVCLNVLNRVRNFASEARPVSEKLVRDLFGTIKSTVSSEDDLRMIFDQKESLSILVSSVLKYNLYLSQLDINLLTQASHEVVIQDQKAAVSSFLETSSKWAIQWLAPKLPSLVCHRDDLPIIDLKTLIQLGFSHMEHLMARAKNPAYRDEVRVQIFTQSLGESLLEALYALYEGLKQQREQKEHALCIFAFIAEVFTIMEDYIQPAVMARMVLLVTQLVNEVSRPSFFSEEVQKEYFGLLTTLMQRVPKLFASDAGTEYLAVFACSSASLFGSSADSRTVFERQVKRTLLSIKQRDVVDKFKRSIFYCLMLKTMLSLEKMDEFKAYRLLSTTCVDVALLDEVAELRDANLEPVQLARLVLATRFIKVFQTAILLHVSSKKATQTYSISRQQEECAYGRMIEDLTKAVLRSRQTVYFMRLVPALMHAGFVSQRTKEAVLASFDKMLDQHAVKERNLAAEAEGPKLIETTGLAGTLNDQCSASKFLGEADRDFIQKHCIDAIRLKKQERITKAVKAEHIQMKEEHKEVAQDLLQNSSASAECKEANSAEGQAARQEEEKKVAGVVQPPKVTKSNAEVRAVLGKKKSRRQPSRDADETAAKRSGTEKKSQATKGISQSRRRKETK